MGHDPKRRFYVVTASRQPNETPEECDERVVDLLGVRIGSTAVTCTVYEPSTDVFRKLHRP